MHSKKKKKKERRECLHVSLCSHLGDVTRSKKKKNLSSEEDQDVPLGHPIEAL